MPKILLVDDDRNLLRVLAYHLAEAGFEVISLTSPRAALERLEEDQDLLITDLRMPEMDGLELLREARLRRPRLPIIVLTAHGTIDRAVEAIRAGASDFLTKPFEKEEILHAVHRALQMAGLIEENRRLSREVQARFRFKGITGSSKAFLEVLSMAEQLAEVETTVLLTGESGTGKELLARAIHFNSNRNSGPFVVVNCAAIPSDLMEAELFGYKKGSFTGALADRKGKFEVANGGSIFLDEIGELPVNMQAKLLRVLQEREVDVLGESQPRAVNVRVLAATNRNLQEMMQQGIFREDLFYRLSVAPIHLPPLRERREDIPLLVHHLLEKLVARTGKEAVISAEAVEALQRYDWPGNVRELENQLERLVVFNRTGIIGIEDLPAELRRPTRVLGKLRLELPESGFSLEELERDILAAALERHGGNQSRAARYLGISRNTLLYRMQKFNLR